RSDARAASSAARMGTEMGMLTKLHNVWLNWLVEYEDGGYEGGYAWRGRPGTGFAAAHHVVDGVSTARSDAEVVTHFTGRGSVSRVDLALGQDRKSTRLNSSHSQISYAVFCLKKKKHNNENPRRDDH